MKRRKIYLMICAVSAMILSGINVAAQPSAQNDWFSVLQGSCSYYLDVAANDNAVAGYSLQIDSQAHSGLASVNGNFLSYCPDSNFIGADRFKYSVADSNGTRSATVYINVLPSNNFIFPGDADQNGRVENFDVLALGLAYNLKGPSRFDSVSVNALAWSPSVFTSADPGAADCNGDGIVDAGDLFSIENSYHDTFPYPNFFEIDTSRNTPTGVPFYIESLTYDTVNNLDTLDIVIKLGNGATLNEAYGIAFTLEYNNEFVNGNAATFSSSSSWLLQNDAGLFLQKNFQPVGKTEIALTRTMHASAHGGGEVLRMRMPIDDNIDGIANPPGFYNLNLQLKKVRLTNEYNVLRDIYIQQQSLYVYKNASAILSAGTGDLKIYPNPVSNILFIEADKIHEVEMFDIIGRRIFTLQENSADKIQINLNEFLPANGNYLMKIKTNDFSITQKIFVQH